MKTTQLKTDRAAHIAMLANFIPSDTAGIVAVASRALVDCDLAALAGDEAAREAAMCRYEAAIGKINRRSLNGAVSDGNAVETVLEQAIAATRSAAPASGLATNERELKVKPSMMLKWSGEAGQPISRDQAARVIRGNRRAKPYLQVSVTRKHGETYIASTVLGVACCLHRADQAPIR